MDFRSFIQYIASHYVLVSGSTLALFFATAMILLIRSIGEQNERDVGSGSGVDLQAIEGAMKRVLSSQPISVVAAVGSAPTAGTPAMTLDASSGLDAAQVDAMNAALRERESTIDELRAELAQAKDTITQMAETSGGSASEEELRMVKAKVDELQGRLAEYEIIEDDIADLSMYKDENARLKAEVERLKAGGAASPPEPVAEVKFEKAESFELDPNDDVMKEFAAAVSEQKAPPPKSASGVSEAPMVDAAESASFAAAADPQAAIDALLRGEAASEPTPAPAAAPAPAAPKPAAAAIPADPDKAQAAIDALLFGDATLTEQPTAEVAPIVDQEAAQAAIDELLAETAAAPTKTDAHTDGSEILSGTSDPEKLLSEVQSIAPASDVDQGDPLEESLDTDKLLAEVDSLNSESSSSGDAALEEVLAEFNKKAAGG